MINGVEGEDRNLHPGLDLAIAWTSGRMGADECALSQLPVTLWVRRRPVRWLKMYYRLTMDVVARP